VLSSTWAATGIALGQRHKLGDRRGVGFLVHLEIHFQTSGFLEKKRLRIETASANLFS